MPRGDAGRFAVRGSPSTSDQRATSWLCDTKARCPLSRGTGMRPKRARIPRRKPGRSGSAAGRRTDQATPRCQHSPPGEPPVHSLHEHRLDADDRDARDRERMVGEMVDGPLGLLVRVGGTDRPNHQAASADSSSTDAACMFLATPVRTRTQVVSVAAPQYSRAMLRNSWHRNPPIMIASV